MARTERAQVLTVHPDLRYRGIDDAELHHLGRGAATRSIEWNDLYAEGRLRTRADAVWWRQKNTHIAYSHTTAAALHRLPLYRVPSDRVDLIVPGRFGRKNCSDVIRHHLPLTVADVVEIDGMRVTSLDRTVFDVVRTVSLECAVTVFDAALRRVGWDKATNTYDDEAAERFRVRVMARIGAATGARGIRQARFVAEFADGRADRPGESVSRLWMWQLSLPAPVLQYRVDLDDGSYALLDFAWPELSRWGEFDGEGKFSDPEMLAGRTRDQVLREQAQRERKVRQRTGWRVDRWNFEIAPDFESFAAYMRSIGMTRR